MKDKCSYGKKGSVPLKTDAGTFQLMLVLNLELAKEKLGVWEPLNSVVSFLAFISVSNLVGPKVFKRT